MPLPVVTFSGTGSAPVVAAASAPNDGQVLVRFSRAMDPTSGLLTPGNYSITGTTIVSVTTIDNTIVTLNTSGTTPDANYTVTVAMTLTDTVGNALGSPNSAVFHTPPTGAFVPFTSPGIAPVFPSGDSQLDCGEEAFSQDDLLALFERVLPEAYILPLKNGVYEGYELLQAYAAIWARMSLAAERIICSAQFLSAPDAAFASGEVEFFRAIGGPKVTIKAGTILEASGFGKLNFRTTADATLDLNVAGPVTAPVVAVVSGYESNVLGQITLPNGDILPGAIDTFAIPFQDPPLADPTVQVRQPNDLTGGAPAALDQLGNDRGIPRQVGEPSSRYRARVRALPDTISPDAINRVITDLLATLAPGLTFDFIECFEKSYQTCFDAPATANPGSTFDPNLFCYDDPRPPIPFRNRWLTESDHYGGFIVVMPKIPVLHDFGIAYDDPATVPGDFVSNVGGNRAYAAFDIPNDASLFAGCYDGYDANLAALYVGVEEILARIKAGGISSALEILGDG